MEISIGSVVKSKAGHDKGDWFIVLEIQNDYAMIADGNLRKVDKPKKKKMKHLQKTNYISEMISEAIKNQQTVTNSDVRKALLEYLQN